MSLFIILLNERILKGLENWGVFISSIRKMFRMERKQRSIKNELQSLGEEIENLKYCNNNIEKIQTIRQRIGEIIEMENLPSLYLERLDKIFLINSKSNNATKDEKGKWRSGKNRLIQLIKDILNNIHVA